MTLFFWIGFSIAVGALAGKYGRSAIGWVFLALVISPVLAIIFLLIAGRTLEQRAREAALVQQIVAGGQPLTLPAAARPVQYGPKYPWRAIFAIIALIALLYAMTGYRGDQPRPAAFLQSDWKAAPSSAPEPAPAPVTKVPADVRGKAQKTKQPAGDPVQDAVARQLQAMPGVSRW